MIGNGTGESISYRTSAIDDVYFAEEVAYNIINEKTSEDKGLFAGDSATFEAKLLNQIGSEGYLDQTITWLVMNEDRTEEMPGFIMDVDDTTKELTLTVCEEAENGKYVVLAYSEKYDMAMGQTINVCGKASFVDYVPEELNDNLLGHYDVSPEREFFLKGTRHNTSIDSDTNIEVRDNAHWSNETGIYQTRAMKIFSDLNIPGAGVAGLSFAPWRPNQKEPNKATTWFRFDKSKNYVFKIDLKDNYLAENKSVGMIIEKIPENASTQLTLDNSLVLKGGYANQVGAISVDEQNLRWYILNSARKEIVDTFIINTSNNEKDAEVKATEITKSGSYYVVLESEEKDGTVKRISLPITVKKPEMAEAIANSLKTNTKEELKDKVEIFAQGLGIGFYSDSAIDVEKCAELLEKEADAAKLDTKADVKKFIEKALFIEILNKGTRTDLLIDKSGKIDAIDSLDLEKYDVDGVTIYKLFTDTKKYNYIDNDGIRNVINSLKQQGFTSFAEFDGKIIEEIVLNIIAYPGVYGTSYISDVLTKANGEKIGLDMTKYLAYDDDDKNAKNEEIARNLYKKSALQTILDTAPEADEGSGSSGSSGGSGGGFGGAPVKTGFDVVEPAVTPAPVVQDDVTVSNFVDVPDSHWAYADIYHLREIGVVSGVAENMFLPDGTVTREQFIKMFVGAMKYELSSYNAGFSDVKESDWFAPYIATAVDKGIITGISSDVFGVSKPITRQDVCVIISRAMENVDGSNELTFSDANSIDEYAEDAVSYLTSFNVIKGFNDNTFRPKDYCTRAQVAKIICTILSMKGLVN